MPIPQVNDRIKEAPVVVLRAVFAGIGQLLLTADKVRAKAAEQVWSPDRPVPDQVNGGRSCAYPELLVLENCEHSSHCRSWL